MCSDATKPMEQKSKPLQFVLDKNLELHIYKEPWSGILKAAGIDTEVTTDLVHIDTLIKDDGPDIVYVPGADYCRSVLHGNCHYQGLVIATSKFTCEPNQRTLLVVRKDDPATNINDLQGSAYGYMNKSCSSSYFPPAIILNNMGKRLSDFFSLVEVPGWQPRVDAVAAKKIRSTMILEDVWKMTPSNGDNCKIIGQMDGCPPAILAVSKSLAPERVNKAREHLLTYSPSWETIYGAFRPFYYADIQTFIHHLSELPSDI